uniref:Uncharacterized protein n=2 Tax=Anguilla anguilla TaxID=7936 RepID=A0A0E9XWH7_ANGAN
MSTVHIISFCTVMNLLPKAPWITSFAK